MEICPCTNLTNYEIDDQYPNTSPSFRFHIYHVVAHCTKHGRIPLIDKIFFRKIKQDTASEQSTKIYTRKELVMMEKIISNFHKSFYIPEIQKFPFRIPHKQILGTNHCGEYLQTAFKCSK